MAGGGIIKIKVKILDKEKVKQWLEKLKRDLDGPAFMKALEAGAKVYVKGAQGRAPFDTGKLMNSIHHERAQDSEKGFAITPTEDLIPIYASVQEFGATTHPGNVFVVSLGGVVKRPGHIPAVRYMQRTFDQDTEKAFEAFRKELWDRLGE